MLVPMHQQKLVNYSFGNAIVSRYRIWHVESLLNQGADLLDRALRERASLRAIEEKQALLELELKLRAEQHALQEEFFNSPPRSALLRNIEDEIALRKDLQKEFDKILTIQNRLHESAGKEDSKKLGIGEATISAELNALCHSNLRRQLSADTGENAHRKKLLDLELSHIDLKRALTQEGQPLDYKSQISDLTSRIERDYREAYDRLYVANDGLNKLFGYSAKNNRTFPTNDPEKDGNLPIEALTTWVRDAIGWLVGFSQLDQAFTVTLSAREFLEGNEEGWVRAIAAARDVLELNVRAPRSLFDSHSYVRLRGIVLFLRSNEAFETPLRAKIWVPEQALIRQGVGGSLPIAEVKVDQSDVPACTIGRIESRNSRRSPEIAGSISLKNSSPIGESRNDRKGDWRVVVSGSGFNQPNWGNLTDLQIELSLTGRPL